MFKVAGCWMLDTGCWILVIPGSLPGPYAFRQGSHSPISEEIPTTRGSLGRLMNLFVLQLKDPSLRSGIGNTPIFKSIFINSSTTPAARSELAKGLYQHMIVRKD